MNVPFVDLGWQENRIQRDRENRFADIISRTAFVLGPDVEEFERDFSEYCGTARTIGVANGTDALLLIYQALGIGEGDEVITIPSTFIASVSPLLHLGATPVFADIDPVTRNFDMELLESAITPRTKAILAVHLYGIPADMDAITALAEKHGIAVVEDACQAQGARYKEARAGSLGTAAAFSFYPGKNLGAYGDAGAVTTSNTSLAARIEKLRNHGGIQKYEHELLGYNSRLDTLQAAVLIEKLKHLDEWNDLRRSIASRYLDRLAGLPLALPSILPDTEPVWHLFVIEVEHEARSRFTQAMKEKGVATGIHYPEPLHTVPALRALGHEVGSFPHAERLAAGCVSLPMYPGMTDEQVEYVIEQVASYFHGNA